MPDALRDRIALYLDGTFSGVSPQNAEDIAAIVRDFATSDAAVKRALCAGYSDDEEGDMRAAILAALGGNDG